MIKLLIVDDSTFMRKAFRHMVSFDPEIEVVGEAGDGKDAMDKVLSLKPDVVTMDLIMPGVDGLWALEEIMKQRPTPIVVVSSIATKTSEITKEAFTMGVVDVLCKPDNPQNISVIQKEFIETIKAASRVSRMRIMEHKLSLATKKTPSTMMAHQAVVIATSAGGPTSLYEVMSRFSDNFYGTVVIAQHMPAQFMTSFVSHMQTMTPFPVKISEKGDLLFSRRALFSPTDSTLEVHRTKKGCVTDIVDFKVRLQPDINHVIMSTAESFKSSTVLVVLSGLGNDGVKGAEVVRSYGGKVIVEDESTASVYSGMPSNVVKSGNYDILCPSYKIAEAVESCLTNKPFDQNKKEFMVKGLIIKNTLQSIKTKYTPEAAEKVVSMLSEKNRSIISSGLKQYNYYSSEIYYDLYQGVQNVLGMSKPNILQELGEENARECVEAYKTALTLSSLTEFNAFLQGLYKTVFPGIIYEQMEILNQSKMLRYVLRSNGYNEENIKISAMIVKGWLSFIAKTLNFNLVSCTCNGLKDEKGPKICCELAWK